VETSEPATAPEQSPRPADPALKPESSVAFLLVQLGFHLAGRFGELLAPLGLEQRHAGMLVRLAENDGKSQQAIAELLGVNATRMVFLTDELEQLGLVERRRNPADRRSHALHLTEAGRAMLARIGQVTAAHEADVTASLSDAERTELAALLRRIADGQGLAAHRLPGPPPHRSAGSDPATPPRPPAGPGGHGAD
jgi:DNA-binding MarR family transcriptional regulator